MKTLRPLVVWVTAISLTAAVVVCGCAGAPHPPVSPAARCELSDIAWAIDHIDDHYRAGKMDDTPGIRRLVAFGPKIIRLVLPLATSESDWTRYCAVQVLWQVTSREFAGPNAAAEHVAAWSALGNLDPASDARSRAASVALWQDWLDSGGPQLAVEEWRRLRGRPAPATAFTTPAFERDPFELPASKPEAYNRQNGGR